MAYISACSGIGVEKDVLNLNKRCKLRHECKRYQIHLDSISKQQSYIAAQFTDDNTCEMKKEL